MCSLWSLARAGGAASKLTCMAVGRSFSSSSSLSFLRESKERVREREREPPAFYNLILEVTCHHFCHMLLVIHTKYGISWEGTAVCQEGTVGGQLPQAGYLSFFQKASMSPCREPSSVVVSGNSTGNKTDKVPTSGSLHFCGETDKIQVNM